MRPAIRAAQWQIHSQFFIRQHGITGTPRRQKVFRLLIARSAQFRCPGIRFAVANDRPRKSKPRRLAPASHMIEAVLRMRRSRSAPVSDPYPKQLPAQSLRQSHRPRSAPLSDRQRFAARRAQPARRMIVRTKLEPCDAYTQLVRKYIMPLRRRRPRPARRPASIGRRH